MSDIAMVLVLLPLLVIMVLVAVDPGGYLFFGRPSLIAFALYLLQLPDEEVEAITERLRLAAKKGRPK